MGKASLKATVLLGMGALVVSCCLITAFVAAHRYSQSLEETLEMHARALAKSLAAPLTEMVLINNMIDAQRLLDSQFKGDMAQGYALLEHKGRVLVHTIDAGIPPELAELEPHPNVSSGRETNAEGSPTPTAQTPHVHTVTLPGERRYLEVTWPLLDGHAGILRMGFSRKDMEERITYLWRETTALTLIILLLALTAGGLWLRRVGRPLTALVHCIESLGSGNLAARITVSAQGEVGTLARAFNRMSEKLEGTMLSMEAQAAALRRSHGQLKLCNDIVTTFAALDGLTAMLLRLRGHLQDMVHAPQSLILLNNERRTLILTQEEGCRRSHSEEDWHAALSLLEGRESTFTTKGLREPLVSAAVAACPRQTVICMEYELALCGALVVGHEEEQSLEEADMAVLALLLNQVAGSLQRALRREKEARSADDADPDIFWGMAGRSQAMRAIFHRIEDVAPSDATVLITGESGTGKELAARAIHNLSPRSARPFVVINCAAYPESLLESELFGYEKGAFTGATRQKPGRFEQADGGTVFLDEIGEISPMAQVRLLRVLQTRQFERVGGEKTLSVDVRILAATNRDLALEVREGRFREDLYYRLDVISLSMPPLRQRMEDLPLLARHCLERLAAQSGKKPCTLSSGAMRKLMEHDWPGNVRELENLLEQCATLSRHTDITEADLPTRLRSPAPRTGTPATLEEQEAAGIRDALELCGWNRKQAAQRLGIGRTTLYAKMKRYDISPPPLPENATKA